ncbi:MAG: hypothetical protein ACJ72W_25920 [Actinoallomurus sp.]
MAAVRRSLKRELDDLRATMRADGRTWREIAQVVRDRHRVNPRIAFRLAHGWTQEDVARLYNERWPESPKTPKHVSYWENWEPGAPPSPSARTPSYETLDRLAQLYECSIADLLGSPDYGHRGRNRDQPADPRVSGRSPAHDGDADRSLGSREEADPTKRRDLLGLGLTATLAPETLRHVLREAAAEAMEFTRLTGVSNVGKGTLDHLEAAITELNRSYQTEPPAQQFVVARAYRRRVEELIQGPHTLKEGRELYVYAAAFDEALAWLAHDLGDLVAAWAYAIDCYEHADQAGHDELCAWAGDIMASVAMYTKRPERAVEGAYRGLRKVSDRHPMAVRLRARAARAHARLGRRDDCESLLVEAAALTDRLPSTPAHHFTLDTSVLAAHALTAYSASAFIWLEDFERARRHALQALAVHEATRHPESAPGREAIARIDLAIALAGLGEPDAAIDEGTRALGSPRYVHSLRARLAELSTALLARYPDLPDAREFDERCRELARR